MSWRDDPPALVLAGGTGWDEDVDAAIAEVPSHLRVVRPGYLRFADLPGFLGGATVVAFPSHGEGFGLPVLEAMACGTPVLTTQRLSLPEVGGDAVAYTEPDAASIGAALSALLDDAARRRALADAALARSREFTWAASAEAHLASYARAVVAGLSSALCVEAVVLVGGQGTRLQPLTLRTPKPMLPFAGAPFLTHQLARLRAAGVDHVVLATSYRSEVFHEHFGNGKDLGMRIDYVTETEPLGTGGGIRNVARRLESGPDDPVLIVNGDVLSGHDIRRPARAAPPPRCGGDAAPGRGRGRARVRLRAHGLARPGDRLHREVDPSRSRIGSTPAVTSSPAR